MFEAPSSTFYRTNSGIQLRWNFLGSYMLELMCGSEPILDDDFAWDFFMEKLFSTRIQNRIDTLCFYYYSKLRKL